MTADVPALLDVNVLIALTWPQHVHHSRAHDWLSSRPGQWATTPLTEAAFVRLSLNPRLVGATVSAAEALALLERARRQSEHVFVPDDSSLAEPGIDLRRLAGHGQVTDFHLVNLCGKNGMRLATLDGSLVEALEPEDRRHVELLT